MPSINRKVLPTSETFSKAFAEKGIFAYFAALAVCSLLFFNRPLPLIWIVSGMIEVCFFFYFSYRLTRQWKSIPILLFKRKIFYYSLAIRVLSTLFFYLFFLEKNDFPFEFDAADSLGYHGEALWIIYLLGIDELDFYFNSYLRGFSDAGWPLMLAVIYLLSFKSILAARLVNCLLGSWMVVMVYKLSERNFGEPAARISAILSMLFPTFIFYSGLHLKETAMIFLLVAFTERADSLIRNKTLNAGNFFIVIMLGASLFFFRTVLAVAAWISLITAFILSPQHIIQHSRKAFYIICLALAGLFLFSGKIRTEIGTYYHGKSSNQASQMEHFTNRNSGNRLAHYGSSALFIPVILAAPFPTLVNTGQPNVMMITGNLFVRNVLSFFTITALFLLYTRKLILRHTLILSMLFSYLAILSLSGYALSERFHLPILPFFLILAGYGVSGTGKKLYSYYIPYLVVIILLVAGWNWFKLAGRGIT